MDSTKGTMNATIEYRGQLIEVCPPQFVRGTHDGTVYLVKTNSIDPQHRASDSENQCPQFLSIDAAKEWIDAK